MDLNSLPFRSNSHRLNLGAAWSLPLLDRSHCPWPTHDRSLSFSIYLFLYPNLRSLFLPPFLSLTEFLSLTNGFDFIFVSLSLFIEIFYYKICLEAEKMWETNRKIAFLECNKTLENIFHNVTKHLKNFPFPKIFSPANILHSENILHVAKCSLSFCIAFLFVFPKPLHVITLEW